MHAQHSSAQSLKPQFRPEADLLSHWPCRTVQPAVVAEAAVLRLHKARDPDSVIAPFLLTASGGCALNSIDLLGMFGQSLLGDPCILSRHATSRRERRPSAPSS